MTGIVAKHRQQMKFFNSHLTHNIFNLYSRRFFFGLVYIKQLVVMNFIFGKVLLSLLFYADNPYFFTTFPNFYPFFFPTFLLMST